MTVNKQKYSSSNILMCSVSVLLNIHLTHQGVGPKHLSFKIILIGREREFSVMLTLPFRSQLCAKMLLKISLVLIALHVIFSEA